MADTLAAEARPARITGPGYTAAGRPRAGERTLPPLDTDRIAEQEERYVARAVGRLLDDDASEADLEQVAEKMARIVKKANEAIVSLSPARDAAALSLALNDGVRAVYRAAGYTRGWFVQLKRDAESVGGVPRVRGAEKKAVDLGEQVYRAQARKKAAIKARDKAAVRLVRDLGRTHRSVADLIGTTEGLVAQRMKKTV